MPNSESSTLSKFFKRLIQKTSAEDGIPAMLLKKCAPELALIRTHLFQVSYNTGILLLLNTI